MYESSFLKLNDKLNWSCKKRDILYRYGFIDVWLSQGVSFDYFNLSLADEHVGDVTIPTQVIEYNQNFLQAD
jgi:hypothetical protein